MRLMASAPIIAVITLLVVTIGTVSYYSFLQVEAEPFDPLTFGDVVGDSIMISEEMICLVTDIGKLDGWVTYFVKATRFVSDPSVGAPPAILDVTAKYTPHKADGSHLAEVTQQLIYSEGENGVGFVEFIEFASISVPAHEDTDHTHVVKFSHNGIGGTKDVHVASCNA